LTGPLETIIIIEDSGDHTIHGTLSRFDHDFIVLVNDTKLGQMGSIDRAYQKVTTPYIFHCEDDWVFTRAGFIEESASLLVKYEQISMVGLRPRQDLNPLTREVPAKKYQGIEFFFYDPSRHPEYFSYSFNPGLRRLDDYKRIGPYAKLGYEPDVSYAFKRAGFQMAGLEHPAALHIGWDRHLDDPCQPKRSGNLANRLKKSFWKRYKRITRSYHST
jgi:hypothetical protein